MTGEEVEARKAVLGALYSFPFRSHRATRVRHMTVHGGGNNPALRNNLKLKF